MRRASSVLILLLATIASGLASAGQCTASAKKTSYEIDGGDVLVEFDVSPRNCSSGCSGMVEYRLHYKSKNGKDHFYQGMERWRSNDGSEIAIVHKGYEGFCSTSSLGPCRARAVEVLKVSCYDR